MRRSTVISAALMLGAAGAACKKDEGPIETRDAPSSPRDAPPRAALALGTAPDQEPPPGPRSFTARSGLGRGVVEIDVQGLPADRSDFAALQVHLSEVAMPETCDAWRNPYVAFPLDVHENFGATLRATPGATLYLRLCIADAAGNVSGGLTASA